MLVKIGNKVKLVKGKMGKNFPIKEAS